MDRQHILPLKDRLLVLAGLLLAPCPRAGGADLRARVALGLGGVEPLERVAVEEGPVGDGDERREHDAGGVDEQHELEVPAHVARQERRHGRRHMQHLHQHLRELPPANPSSATKRPASISSSSNLREGLKLQKYE